MNSEIFTCNACTKSVNTQGELNRHLKTHSKPFRCDQCQLGFALRSDLNRHIKARHRVGNEQYHCRIPGCLFSSARKDNLSRHLRRSHGYEPQIPKDEGSPKVNKKRRLTLSPSPSNSGTEQIYNSAMLLGAATLGNITLLQICLQARVALDSKADDGSTALHCAARAGQTMTAQYLIEMGANVGILDMKRQSPLMHGVLSGNPDTAKLLFEKTTKSQLAEVRSKLEDCVAQSGSLEIVKTYVKSLETTSESMEFTKIFSIAVRQGQDKTVAALLGHPDVDVKGLDDSGNAPIHNAARKGNAKVMELLIASDRIDSNIKTKRMNMTPLHIAARKGCLEGVKRLARVEGIELNCRDSNQQTPLHLSANHGRLAVTDFFLRDEMTDTGCLDRYKISPLQIAASRQRWEVVKLLLNYYEDPQRYSTIRDHAPNQDTFIKADVVKKLLGHSDFQNPNMYLDAVLRRTLLQHAAENGDSEVIQVLLIHEYIEVNAQDWLGTTPVICAALHNRIEAAKLLLQHKDIDINHKNHFGRSALYWAKCRNHPEMVDLLISHGAISTEDDPPWPRTSNGEANHIPPAAPLNVPQNNASESDNELESENSGDEFMDDVAAEAWKTFQSIEGREKEGIEDGEDMEDMEE